MAGFTKAYKRERPEALVKVVDFEASANAADVAEALLDETLADPGIVEVGRKDGLRWTVSLEERPARDGTPGLTLGKESVFVVTGAAGGITSAIVADLAAASGGTFYLLDLVPEPRRDDPKIALFRTDREGLKRALIEEAKGRGEKPTPAVDRPDDPRHRAVGRGAPRDRVGRGRRRDGPLAKREPARRRRRSTAVVDEIRARHGRIDVLVHAGGVEISRKLTDKEPTEFDLVFDIKADGFFSLLRAAEGMPLGATVVFSSVAGRFGNDGQTDYSAANELLCTISSWLRKHRPETRAIAIDWTAWGGIGMATRGSIPKIMEAAGIDMLPPEAGIPTVRRELVASAFSGEIVVAGRLGVLGAEWDRRGASTPRRRTPASPGATAPSSPSAASSRRAFTMACSRRRPSTRRCSPSSSITRSRERRSFRASWGPRRSPRSRASSARASTWRPSRKKSSSVPSSSSGCFRRLSISRRRQPRPGPAATSSSRRRSPPSRSRSRTSPPSSVSTSARGS